MEILRDNPIELSGTPEQAPLEERLRYGTSFHQQLVARIRSRLLMSERHISQRYDDWDRANEHTQLYVDLTRAARRGDRSLDTRKREMPVQRSIVVPMAYSVLAVRMTALWGVFTARDPMIQIEGRGPEDVTPAKMMEAMLAYDMAQTRMQLAMWGFLMNAEQYGLGVLTEHFEKEQGWKFQRQQADPLQQIMAQLLGQQQQPQQQYTWGVTREYERVEVCDPYEFRPDPRVAGSHPEDMEFCGHRTRYAHSWLLSRSAEFGGPYMNVPFIRQAMHRRREQTDRRRRTTDLTTSLDTRDIADSVDHGVYSGEVLQVRIVPREWGLGTESRPEIWQFTLIEDTVIIQAERRPNIHNQFSYSVAQTHYDPHAAFTQGMIEQLDGLQRFMSWLYNSHVDNVRRTINDALIYGPSWIDESALLNPSPGRHIPLTRKGEELVERGMLGLGQFTQQLGMTDITATHLREVQTLFDMVQRMTGINDPAMGQPTESKRTLGEIQRILVSSSRRLTTQAQLYDVQAIQPLAYRMLMDRQQFTSMEQYIRITGRLAQELKQERLLMRKDDIQGSFDYMPISGTMPPDPESQAETWTGFMAAASHMPQLLQPGPDGRVLDPRWLFRQFAQSLGLKNIEDAFIQVMPPGPMGAGIQAGNLVPAGAVPPAGRIPGAGIQGPMVPGGIPGAPPRPGGLRVA